MMAQFAARGLPADGEAKFLKDPLAESDDRDRTTQ